MGNSRQTLEGFHFSLFLMSFLRDVSAPMGKESGPPCTACQEPCSGDRAIQWQGVPYHRNCLSCTRCKTILSNNIAEHKSRPVCLQCHAYYQGKTCDRCGEGAPSAVQAMGKRFHRDCFTCAFCDKKLLKDGGQAEFCEFEGRPFHEDCLREKEGREASGDGDSRSAWELVSAEHKCSTCNKTIPTGEGLSVAAPPSKSSSGRLYFCEGCFKCDKCSRQLSGQFVAGDKGYLCNRCGDAAGVKPAKGNPCTACGQPLSGAITRALGKEYHKECFRCSSCKANFANGEFYEKDGKAV